jgi:hypothetical protein
MRMSYFTGAKMKTTIDDISPEEFAARCEKAIEAIALANAHHPNSETEPALARLAESLYKDWRALLPSTEPPDEVFKEAVIGVLQQVRQLKRKIEEVGVGTA